MRKFTNFFKPTLTISIFFLISNITFAQQETLVKRSYVDSINAATTVVVKNEAASDLDILNNQFENASFNDVIFIKTEDLPSSKPKSERTSFEDVIKATSQPSKNKATTSISKKEIAKPKAKPLVQSKITKPKAKPLAQPKKIVKKDKNQVKKTITPKIKTPQKYFGVGGSRKLKMKKKKLKKRRRVKRGKRNKCFEF